MWRHLSNYTVEERIESLKTYFKLFFVREPLQRLLSAYKHKFILTPSYTSELRTEIVQALRPQDFQLNGINFVKFQEFIQYLSNNMSRDQHWRKYEKLCHPCVINYDFIGHFETFKRGRGFVTKNGRNWRNFHANPQFNRSIWRVGILFPGSFLVYQAVGRAVSQWLWNVWLWVSRSCEKVFGSVYESLAVPLLEPTDYLVIKVQLYAVKQWLFRKCAMRRKCQGWWKGSHAFASSLTEATQSARTWHDNP